MNNILALLPLIAGSGENVTDPLYNGITVVGPVALSIVLALSMIYGIFLGVKYSKCEEASEKANVQKTLVNFIIGAVTVVILISVIYAIRGPLTAWING